MKKHARTQQHKSQNQLVGIAIVVIAILAFLILIGFTMSGSTQDFTGTLLTGETVKLSDYRGKVVMLNFWATWCPPCRAEMPSIQEAYNNYQERGFVVLAINNSETPLEVQNFANYFGLTLPIVLDVDGRLQRSFGLRSYPTSLFINADGAVYASHNGMLSELQLTNYIEMGLAQSQG